MPLPGQVPEGPDGKYSPLQMADWLIDKASDFKSGQDLLDAISDYGLDMTPSDAAPMDEPMMDEPMMDDPMMDDPMMEEPPMAEDEDKDKGKGKKGPAFLEIMRIGAAEKAIDKDKKKKKKAKDEEEGY